MGAGLKEQISEAVCSGTISVWREEEHQPFALEALVQNPGKWAQRPGPRGTSDPVRLRAQASLRGRLAVDGEPFDTSALRLALRAPESGIYGSPSQHQQPS